MSEQKQNRIRHKLKKIKREMSSQTLSLPWHQPTSPSPYSKHYVVNYFCTEKQV